MIAAFRSLGRAKRPVLTWARQARPCTQRHSNIHYQRRATVRQPAWTRTARLAPTPPYLKRLIGGEPCHFRDIRCEKYDGGNEPQRRRSGLEARLLLPTTACSNPRSCHVRRDGILAETQNALELRAGSCLLSRQTLLLEAA
jgi:hypothetical protein